MVTIITMKKDVRIVPRLQVYMAQRRDAPYPRREGSSGCSQLDPTQLIPRQMNQTDHEQFYSP